MLPDTGRLSGGEKELEKELYTISGQLVRNQKSASAREMGLG